MPKYSQNQSSPPLGSEEVNDALMEIIQCCIPVPCDDVKVDEDAPNKFEAYKSDGDVVYFIWIDRNVDNLNFLLEVRRMLHREGVSFSYRQLVKEFYWSLTIAKKTKIVQVSGRRYEPPVYPQPSQTTIMPQALQTYVKTMSNHQLCFEATLTCQTLVTKFFSKILYSELTEFLNMSTMPGIIRFLSGGKQVNALKPDFIKFNGLISKMEPRFILRMIYLIILAGSTPAIYSGQRDKLNAEVVFTTMKQVIIIDTLEGICRGHLGRDAVIVMKLVSCICLR